MGSTHPLHSVTLAFQYADGQRHATVSLGDFSKASSARAARPRKDRENQGQPEPTNRYGPNFSPVVNCDRRYGTHCGSFRHSSPISQRWSLRDPHGFAVIALRAMRAAPLLSTTRRLIAQIPTLRTIFAVSRRTPVRRSGLAQGRLWTTESYKVERGSTSIRR